MSNDVRQFKIIDDLTGTELLLPKNPLKEKWDKLYPPTPMPQYSQVCDGYSCMWCGRCPKGDGWRVPEEDKEVWETYQRHLDMCGQIKLNISTS